MGAHTHLSLRAPRWDSLGNDRVHKTPEHSKHAAQGLAGVRTAERDKAEPVCKMKLQPLISHKARTFSVQARTTIILVLIQGPTRTTNTRAGHVAGYGKGG